MNHPGLFGACEHGIPRHKHCIGCAIAALGARQPIRFDGKTYEPAHDRERLTGQLARIYDLMRDGRWYTLAQIRESLGEDSEAGISARLRDLRKERFGSHTVERRRAEAGRGLFEYRLIPSKEEDR